VILEAVFTANDLTDIDGKEEREVDQQTGEWTERHTDR